MKISILLTLAMVSLAQAGRKPRPPPAAAVATATAPPSSVPPASAPVAPAAASPTPSRALSPVQSNPPDPGDAFKPRTQSGCLSNIGIAQPTGGVYYRQGDSMSIVILADMFLPQSNTAADIVDASNNTVATLIPTFPVLNFTTVTTAIPLPTAVTPGTYSVRFYQTYSNSFASGMRSQTMQVQMIVGPSGASIPPPMVTTSVNALGLTVLVPRAAATPPPAPAGNSPAPGGGALTQGSGSTAAPGANMSGSGAPASNPSTGSSAITFNIVVAVMLGFVGFLAAL